MADVMMWIFWGLVGWCGTTRPRPKPEPNPFIPVAAGIVGGVIGGFLFDMAFPTEGAMSALDFAATCIGAYAGGRVLSGIVGFGHRDK